MRFEQDYWYLQTSEALWLYTLRYHVIILDRFCWSLSFPQAVSTLTFCELFAVDSPKVQLCKFNVRKLYELPDFGLLNSPDLNTFILKYGAASLAEKVQDVDDLRQNLIDA